MTLRAVDRELFDHDRGLFVAKHRLFAPRLEMLWPFANEWSAHCAYRAIPSGPDGPGHDHLGLLKHYRVDDPPARTGGYVLKADPRRSAHGPIYYDDNAWIALALLREFAVSGDDEALDLCRKLWVFLVSGWSTSDWAIPGGIVWKATGSSSTRHTCTNAPACEVAAGIGLLTGEDRLCEWAVRLYNWTRAALLGKEDLYHDHIEPDATLHRELWSYNQGAMIGAGVLLFELTGEARYLDEARRTAVAALGRFDLGTLFHEGPAFNAVYFRNLALLSRHLGDEMVTPLHAYTEEMWNKTRQGDTGLFAGTGSPLNNSAPMIELFALLAGAPGCP